MPTISTMKIEIGQKIREVFEASNMKLTDFADRLGTVRQNVYRIFKKSHLDSGLLVKISEVLNHNFFQYYQPPSTSDKQDGHINNNDSSELAEQLELARREVDYLRRIIKLMEEKAELVHRIEEEEVIR